MSQQGTNGEWLFGHLCTQATDGASAVVNRSQDDKNGWDHLLEITPPQNNKLPADLRLPLIACFAQIKTTKKKQLTAKVKLSNAVKVAKSPLPSFVFLFHYQKGKEPTLYGRHIWTDEIEHSLRRAREAGNKPLHKKTITMKFTEGDRLPCNPVDWVMAILSTIDCPTYAKCKSDIVENVGYGEWRYEGQFSVGPLSSVNDLVMNQIGMKDDLPFSDFEMFDQRFGISATTPSESFADGRVSFTQEGRPLTVKLVSSKNDEFDIPSYGWASTLFPIDHPEFRFRIKAGHLNFVFDRNFENQILTVSFSTTEDYPFLEQMGLLALKNWATDGQVKASAQMDEGEICQLTFDTDVKPERWAIEAWESGRLALDVLGRDKCSEIVISFMEFSTAMRNLYALAALSCSDVIRFEATFDEPPSDFDKLCGYSYGKIGDWSFGAIHELACKERSVDGLRYRFNLSKPRIVRRFAFKNSLDSTLEHVKTQFAAYRKAQSVKTAVFGDGDMVKWSSEYGEETDICLQIDD